MEQPADLDSELVAVDSAAVHLIVSAAVADVSCDRQLSSSGQDGMGNSLLGVTVILKLYESVATDCPKKRAAKYHASRTGNIRRKPRGRGSEMKSMSSSA